MALTDRLDDDEGSEQRCHVTPANGEPMFGGEWRPEKGRRRIAGEVLENTRVGDLSQMFFAAVSPSR